MLIVYFDIKELIHWVYLMDMHIAHSNFYYNEDLKRLIRLKNVRKIRKWLIFVRQHSMSDIFV